MILSEEDIVKHVADGLASRPDVSLVKIDATSIGLHLGSDFIRYKNTKDIIDLPSAIETEQIQLNELGGINFPPGACVLACSLERVCMPLDCMGFIQTKGTIARGFVTVHLCDGQIDPGFEGCITLELVNLSNIEYLLKPGIPIAQLFVHKLTKALGRGYSGRYQFASGPTSMRVESSQSEPGITLTPNE